MSEKLLVSILIDNSSSMKGEKIVRLKKALSKFCFDALSFNKAFEYSITVFDGFGAKTIKPFEATEFEDARIPEGGLAFWSQAILISLDDLNRRLVQLKEAGIETYKPWYIILFDGQCYEKIDSALNQLKLTYQSGLFTYFPFALSNEKNDELLEPLTKIKRPLTITNFNYDALFGWLYDTVKTRLSIPITESMKLLNTCFDGWTEK